MNKTAMKGILAAASGEIQGLNRVMAVAPRAYASGPESSGELPAIVGYQTGEYP